MRRIACILIALAAPPAWAQGTTFYDRHGQAQGRMQPDGRGGATFYDRQGQAQGRAAPDGRGGTIFYDRQGRQQGRAVGPPLPPPAQWR